MPQTDAGTAITRYREALHWSKRRLAREVGLSPAYIVQLESGERPVGVKLLARLADAMHVHPYKLLGAAGFISPEHIAEAEDAATRALQDDPDFAGRAAENEPAGTFAWIVSDYLGMLGDDADGVDPELAQIVCIDWSERAPERWKAMQEGKTNAITTSQVADQLEQWGDMLERMEALRAKQTAPIEGWNELTDQQRRLVQQLVNQFRRSADSE
jgi:transcriptional regulator with XRE-family HTH domain